MAWISYTFYGGNSFLCGAFHACFNEVNHLIEFFWGSLGAVFVEYKVDQGMEENSIGMEFLFKSFNEIIFTSIFPVVLSFSYIINRIPWLSNHECEGMVVQ